MVVIFERDYAPYTAKQWGMPADEVDPSVLARVPIRLSYREGYFTDRHQAMPSRSYADLFARMLDHPAISVELGVEALGRVALGDGLASAGGAAPDALVWTGALHRPRRHAENLALRSATTSAAGRVLPPSTSARPSASRDRSSVAASLASLS